MKRTTEEKKPAKVGDLSSDVPEMPEFLAPAPMYDPRPIVDWRCLNPECGFVSQYKQKPTLCPRPGCGGREVDLIDAKTAAAWRSAEALSRTAYKRSQFET